MQLTLNTKKSNIGTCPHGLPLGSCPICNGMSGGASRKADFSAKAGEMSWNECAAIGAFLKAQKQARQTRVQDAQNFAKKIVDFQKKLESIHQKLSIFNAQLENKLPKVIAAPVMFVVQTVLQRPLELVKVLPNMIANLNQKLVDVANKVTSILGEIKNAMIKLVSENISSLKKKIKSLFAIFETLNLNNEDKKIDEEKKMFKLKTFLYSLKRKLTKKDNHG